MQKPTSLIGLRHVALFVTHFSECEHFYVELLGMKVVWRPDADNLYLSNGDDNLALHRAIAKKDFAEPQRLDHMGFFLTQPNEVEKWHDYLSAQGVEIKAAPKQHRDGSRSFYCADPDGNVIQMIYHPGVVKD